MYADPKIRLVYYPVLQITYLLSISINSYEMEKTMEPNSGVVKVLNGERNARKEVSTVPDTESWKNKYQL